MVLQLNSVCRSYNYDGGESVILKNLDLSLAAGEVCAIIGPSGCGKSTLLQIAGLLDRPQSGEVILEGEDMSKASESKRTKVRSHDLGFVYQFHHLLPEFSVIENLIIPQLISGNKKKHAEKYASDILTLLDLYSHQHHFPSQLSGGQQQRAALARAIINKPKLLLADEPTGNLDRDNASMVTDLMLSLAEQQGMAVLMVTHNLEMAARANKILSLVCGRLVEGYL